MKVSAKRRTLHLFPADGRRVVVPETRAPLSTRGIVISAADAHVGYWLRRLAEGDVISLQRALPTL